MTTKKILFLIITIAILATAGVGYYEYSTYARNKNLIETKQQATLYFNNNNLDEAITKAQELSKIDFTKIDGLLLLATSYAQKGSLEFKEKEYGDKAILTAQEILIIDPNNSEAYGIIGYGYEIEQNYSQALENYNKALSLNSNNALAFANRGHVYFLQGNYELALKDYNSAIAIDSTLDKALIGEAGIYARVGSFEKAEPLLRKLLTLDTNNRFKSEAEDTLGVIELKKLNYQDAINHFDKAINFDNKFAIPLVNRAEAKLGTLSMASSSSYQEVFDSVIADAQSAININQNQTSAYIVLGKTVFLLKDFTSAQKIFTQANKVIDTDITLNAMEKVDIGKEIDGWLNLIKQQS